MFNQELQESFTDESVRTGDDKLLLTIAAAGGSYFINAAYEPREISRCSSLSSLACPVLDTRTSALLVVTQWVIYPKNSGLHS